MANEKGLNNRLPGLMANIEAGLLIRFQLNPMEVEVTKEVSYDIENVAGWDAPIVTWVSGGAKHLRFDLMFDRTSEGVGMGLSHESAKFLGVMDFAAQLESFLYPRYDNFFSFSTTKPMRPPPDCYFVYGPRWAKCKLLSAPVKEIVHSPLLVPERMTTSIDLLVVEEGLIHNINTATRKGLAVAGSAISYSEIMSSVGNAALRNLRPWDTLI